MPTDPDGIPKKKKKTVPVSPPKSGRQTDLDRPWALYPGMTERQFMDLFSGRGENGEEQTPENYNSNFLQPMMTLPWVQKAMGKYGVEFQKYMYQAWLLDDFDPNKMESLFPGSRSLYTNSGGGGGGGGGGRAGRLADAEAEVRNQMATLGFNVDDAEVRAVAARVVNEDWSGAKLTDYLTADPARMVNPGSYSEMASRIKDMAASQLVHVDDATAQGWAKRVLSSELDLMTVQNIFAGNARNEFAWAADGLTTGATMRDILAPARDMIARELEINPNDVNLMDTKWRDMVQATNADGTKRAASLTEAVRAARKDGAYANTAGGARMAAQTATILRNVFEG